MQNEIVGRELPMSALLVFEQRRMNESYVAAPPPLPPPLVICPLTGYVVMTNGRKLIF